MNARLWVAAAIAASGAAAQPQQNSGSGDGGSSVFTLGLIGVDATTSSSAAPSQQYFLEFDVMMPLGRERAENPKPPLEHKSWFWFSPRLASVPTAASTSLSSLSSSSIAAGAGAQNIAGITQTFDLEGGFEYNPFSPWNGAQAGWGNSWNRTSIALIAGGGLLTPFSSAAPSEDSLTPNLAAQFQDNPALAAQFPQLAGALCNDGYTANSCPASKTAQSVVAFVPGNRSRLYRDYYAGLRLRTFYFAGDCATSTPSCKVQNTYPGTFDLRFGQDETVTAGHLTGVVMTLAASYPLPGSQGTVRVFGAMFTRLAGNRTTPALALAPVTSTLAISDPSVVVQPFSPTDQDYFRLGLGVDLVPLISKWIGGSR
jgi:hypothetical protein